MDNKNRKVIISQLLQIYLPMLFLFAGTAAIIYFLLFSGQYTAETVQKAGGVAAVYLMFLFAGPIFLLLLPLFMLIALNVKLSLSARNALSGIRMIALRINESAQSAVSAAVRPVIELDAIISVITSRFKKKENDGQ